MKAIDLAELINKTIDDVVFKQWKHEGYMDGWDCEQVAAVIDGEEFVIDITKQVKDLWSYKYHLDFDDEGGTTKAETISWLEQQAVDAVGMNNEYGLKIANYFDLAIEALRE